ncbi:MAG: F0F1 ATP synthase subunit A [Bacteroidota bacterium]
MIRNSLLVFFCIISFITSAQHSLPVSDENQASESEEFNPTEVIMHHIADSHYWNLWSVKDETTGEEKYTSIPLPVILIANGNLDIFLSSEFHHGKHPVVKGDRTYLMHLGKIYLADEKGEITYDEENNVTNIKPLDFSITKNVVGMMVAAILVLLIFTSVARKYKKNPGRPKGLQSFMEPLIIFVRNDIAIPNIGEHKYQKYLPYLLTVFFFILINNIMGLIPILPGGANVTGNIAVTLTLAVLTLLITNFSGNRAYWRHIFAAPGVPIWLYPIMIPVELIGVISKPFALMIRLFANITAGHIIVLSLVSLIFIFKTIWISPVSIAFVLFMDCLELLVAFLQAYIFTLLTALFIGMAVQEHH